LCRENGVSARNQKAQAEWFPFAGRIPAFVDGELTTVPETVVGVRGRGFALCPRMGVALLNKEKPRRVSRGFLFPVLPL
jgi:hypothetical protein